MAALYSHCRLSFAQHGFIATPASCLVLGGIKKKDRDKEYLKIE